MTWSVKEVLTIFDYMLAFFWESILESLPRNKQADDEMQFLVPAMLNIDS